MLMNRNEPIVDGEYYHVYNRGNRKQPIFGDDADYRSFLGKLCDASRKYKVFVIVYTLMPNHFHCILVQTSGGSIQRLMNSVESSAAKHFDLKYGKVGHLFQGRYRYNIISSDESLLSIAKYIHLNPVAAKLVCRPEDWPYSDFKEFVSNAYGLEAAPRLDLNRKEGFFPPCTPSEYIDFVRKDGLDEGILRPRSAWKKDAFYACHTTNDPRPTE
jgi:putative transposase